MDKKPLPPLVFDFNAVAALEAKGISFGENDAENAKALRKIANIGTMYWAGRLHDTPDLSEAAAKAELKGYTVKQVAEHVGQAIKESVGDATAPDQS